jgi:polyphosphate glucokinase
MKRRTLCYDIGGSHIKAQVFDSSGRALSQRLKVDTPRRARPRPTFDILRDLSKELPPFDRIAAGFPGIVKDGKVWSAVNLGAGWVGFDLRSALEREFKTPARVANDADVQGLAAASGDGVELLLTFGTGLGSALFYHGLLIPNLELGHHPFESGQTYEDLLGKRGLLKLGERHWNRKIRSAASLLAKVFNWDHLYLGGGEAKKIRGPLPKNTRVVSNELGLLGGVMLWRLPEVNTDQQKVA